MHYLLKEPMVRLVKQLLTLNTHLLFLNRYELCVTHQMEHNQIQNESSNSEAALKAFRAIAQSRLPASLTA